MPEVYFDIPYYKRLTSSDGWNKQDRVGTHYHVIRAFFRLNMYHLPGPVCIGKKLYVSGHDVKGPIIDRIKTMELETETFQQVDTIKQSIIESECMVKILSEISTQFGDGRILQIGGKVKPEVSEKLKNSFSSEFKITNSSRKLKRVKYEFKDTLPSDFTDRICGVSVYQKCAAELYLIRLDFLNIRYEKSFMGLRKKIKKYPFPENTGSRHPNIISIGAPVAVLNFWELLPESALMIKDADYSPEVIDDAEIEVTCHNLILKDRPYWSIPSHPSLYQLSNVAFPYKWVNKRCNEYTKEELLKIELGESEGSAWWFTHGSGRSGKRESSLHSKQNET